MSSTIALIWIITGPVLLLVAWFRPGVFRMLHEPESLGAKCAQWIVLLGMVVCAMVDLAWGVKWHDASVTTLAGLVFAIHLWIRLVLIGLGKRRSVGHAAPQ